MGDCAVPDLAIFKAASVIHFGHRLSVISHKRLQGSSGFDVGSSREL